MRQYKNSDVILKEIYFDSKRETYVFADSIQSTSKGPYVHYRDVNTDQWGRKPIATFLERFKLTQPIGDNYFKELSVNAFNKAMNVSKKRRINSI